MYMFPVQKGLFIAIWRYVPPAIQAVTFLSQNFGSHDSPLKRPPYTPGNVKISGAYGFSAKFQFLCSKGSCLGTFSLLETARETI